MKVIIKLANKRIADAVVAMLPEKVRGEITGNVIAALAYNSNGVGIGGGALRLHLEGDQLMEQNCGHMGTYETKFLEYEKIDAATQLGRLAELLESPKPKIIPNVTSAPRDGLVLDDKSGIRIGCAVVPKEKVRECRDALQSEKPKEMKFIVKVANRAMISAVAAVMPEKVRERVQAHMEHTLEHYGGDGASRFDMDNSGVMESGWNLWITYMKTQSWSDYVRIDPATQLGTLLDLIESTPAIVKNLADGRDGVVRSGIYVGDEFVTKEKVNECYEALFGEK